ncbi:MAG: DUF4351 domain-containing protein [Acidobacteriota bacterium]
MSNGHDQLFKDLLETFPGDFFRLTHPELAARLTVGALRRTEDYLDHRRGKGRPRRPDLVGELRRNEDDVGIQHIEIERRYSRNMAARIATYNQLLELRYDLPVLSTVLFVFGGPVGITDQIYRRTLLGYTSGQVAYRSIGLEKGRADRWLALDIPLAWALAALMQTPPGMSRAEHKLACLTRMARWESLTPRQGFLLIECVETYLQLEDAEQDEYERLRKDVREVGTMQTRWFEEILEEGRREGHVQGQASGKREMLVRLLERRFGELPNVSRERIATTDPTELDRLTDALLDARSLADLGL